MKRCSGNLGIFGLNLLVPTLTVRSFSTILLVVIISLWGNAAPWPERVVEVEYGTGAGFGQEQFPMNVLGPPDPNSTERTPSSDPRELLTLGSGGWIILAFEDLPIQDDTGADFTVFENPFLIGNGDPPITYMETGIVSVSQDGDSWFTFPYDPATLQGLAGVTPTNGASDPLNPAESGGDSFDLAHLGLPWVSYVRITDADTLVTDSGPSFDLDAVAALHWENEASIEPISHFPVAGELFDLYPNPFNSRVTFQNLSRKSAVSVTVFTISGRSIFTTYLASDHSFSLDATDWAAGMYLVLFSSGNMVFSRKMVLVK